MIYGDFCQARSRLYIHLLNMQKRGRNATPGNDIAIYGSIGGEMVEARPQ